MRFLLGEGGKREKGREITHLEACGDSFKLSYVQYEEGEAITPPFSERWELGQSFEFSDAPPVNG